MRRLMRNAAQQRVLTRAGWVRIASFTSSKTGEEVEIWGREVAGSLLDGVQHDGYPA
jgi:hypothetical protein